MSNKTGGQLTLPLTSRASSWTLNCAPLERARILAGYSYQELARRARVDRATLSDFLNGRRQPTLGTVHRVLKCLDIDPREVFIFQDRAA